MDLKSGIALIGAVFAGVAIVLLFAAVGLGWILLAVAIAVGVVGYIVASVSARSRTSITSLGEFSRGWLIGMNAALNAVILFGLIGDVAGGIVGAAVGVLNLLAVFEPISQSRAYQGVIGWNNWIMPMSWLIVGLGIIFSIVSALLHVVTAGRVPHLRIDKLDVASGTGTIFIKGGLIANLNHRDKALNLGNFAFVGDKSSGMHVDHEAGHTLNLGAFGFVFHLVGAVDEYATRRGRHALSERLAASHDTGTDGSNIPMWA